MRKIKVLIFGMGVVGQATKQLLEENPDIEVTGYDPNIKEYDELKYKDFYLASFICINAENDENGVQQTDNLFSCVRDAVGMSKHVFIRTTILPFTTQKIRQLIDGVSGKLIYHFPEYLREKGGYNSIVDLPIISSCPDDKVMQLLFPKRRTIYYLSNVCEMSKYVQNAFFSTKVTFFNAVSNWCRMNNTSYLDLMEAVFDTAEITGTISKESTRVPGPDGLCGYGGKCLPKDTDAILRKEKAERSASGLVELLEVVQRLNKGYR